MSHDATVSQAVGADFSRHLVLYSGGADSTYFVFREGSAKHLLHYRGLNDDMTRVAVANAMRFERRITVADLNVGGSAALFMHGPRHPYHAVLDASMVLNAGIMALNFGMKGIVLGVTSDDFALDLGALTSILQRAESTFEILTPLLDARGSDLRATLTQEGIPFVSCMVSRNCGQCVKCARDR